MSTNLQLVTECDPSPARPQIAAAIEAVKQAAIDAEAGRAAIGRAEALVAKASAKLAEARDKSIKARTARTARLVSAASTGDDLPDDKAVRTSRADEEWAAEELEDANNALVAVREKFDDPDYETRQAERRLQEAIDVVLAGELEQLKTQVEHAARHLAEKLNVLGFVSRQIGSFDYRAMIYRLDGFRDGFRIPHEFTVPDSPSANAWREAIEALKTNPDAQLPTPAPNGEDLPV